MAPAEPLEPCEVAIDRGKLTAGLNGQRGDERIGDQVTVCPAVAAQAGKDRPVSRAGADHDAVRLPEQILGEPQSVLERARWPEDFEGA
jgi:hypothetical protein